MARNLITVSQVVNDYVITLEGDDYANNASDTLIHNYALRGIREMGFDLMQRVRSLKLSSSNNTVTLPDDFVDLVKIGIVGSDGLVHVFGENKNINYSQKYKTDAAGNNLDSDGDGIFDREDAKSGKTAGGVFGADDFIVFSNYIYQNNIGQIYGLGGGFYEGEYRLNLDQNRIELATNTAIEEVVIEYIADEARSICPTIHIQAEEALRSYIYYKLIERKSSVPTVEKNRARAEYYNERRKANARLKAFSKEEALKTIRKNFKQAPKY